MAYAEPTNVVSREGTRLSLCAGQLGVWTAQQLEPTSPRYNCASYVEIHGPVDEALMRRAVRLALAEAEPLRARFVGTSQIVGPMPDEALEVLDTTGRSDPRAEAEAFMRADLARCPDLERDLLVRHVLVKHAETGWLLYLRHHHIVMDGFGQSTHLLRVAQLYTALVRGEEPPASHAVPLAALVAEEGEYLASDARDRDRAYWLERLKDRPTATSLSGAEPRSGAARNVLRRTSRLGADATSLLHGAAERLNTSPSALLVAAVAAYVHRTTGRETVVLNLPVPARRSKAARATPFMLANQLPVRVEISRGATFAQLVADVTARLAEALRHQRYRGEDVRRELGLAGAQAQLGTPTVNVVTFSGELTFGGAKSTSHFLSAGPVRDLALNFLVEPDRSDITLVADADADLYAGAALASHEKQLLTLLGDAIRRPEEAVGRLRLMSEDERRAVLAAGAGVVRDYPLDTCLHELVLAQAARTPDAVAAQVEGASLTYAELVGRARRLATHLQALGAGPGKVVGVHEERSLNLVVDLLAVLLSGATYLPLDPELPRQRLAFQIEDASVGIVLSRSDLAASLSETGARVVEVDRVLEGLPEGGEIRAGATPDDVAYVIYTSGSTGRPKGVAVPHRGVVNRLLWMQEEYGLGAEDRVLQKTPYTFDVSVWEFFWPLLVGARLHLAEPGAHRDPRALADVVRRHRITTLHFVPTMLDLFLSEPSAAGLGGMRRVFASGEALNPETVGRFFALYGAGAALHNLYGPTEASVDVTYHPCRPEDADGVVPIGRAVANTTLYVLDTGFEPAPFGTPGELCIGGVQLAKGYVNRPELTAERFIDSPFGPGKLYRTGDLARLRHDGVIEYLGRLDQQVKVRGFRVELGEIEAALLSHPSVAQAVVVAPQQPDGQRRLIAYVVSTGGNLDVDELSAMLRERLPEYMVPAHILAQDSLPMLSSGKVDRKALPDPDFSHAGGRTAIAAPETDAERLVHDAFCQVLGRDAVDVCTSFFALGGDSISSIKMRAALERRGVTFAVPELFAAPTIRGLAGRLRPLDPDRGAPRAEPFSLLAPEDRKALPEGVEDAYPLSNLQSGIVFHAAYDDGTSVYRVVTSVHVGLRFDEAALRRALAAVFKRHPALRSSLHLTGFREPLQLVHREVDVPIEVRQDLLGLAPAEQEERLRAWAEAAKFHTFELSRAPLLAFFVHPRGDGSFQLGVVEHHAILDGWSDMAMFDEIVARYQAALAGEELWLPEVPSNFQRFVAAERRALRSDEHRTFWQRELAGVEPAPLPRVSSLGRKGRSKHRRFDVAVDGATAARIGAAARRAQLPLKSLLGAAHVAVLGAVCPGDEVVTGVVSHARLDEEGGEQVIGLFLNTLPLRAKVGGSTWLELARAIHEHEGRTATHRSYPYGQMVREHPGLSLDSYVNFMDFHHGGHKAGAVLGGFGVAETDFALAVDFMIDPVRGRLEAWLDCDVSTLSEAFCERLAGYYARALAELAAAPEGAVASVDLRAPGELERLRTFNDTARTYEIDATIDGLVAAQAQAAPDAAALADPSSQLSYAELDARSLRLANLLRARGASRGSRVGVHVRRKVDLIVALLAVLRTGAAYVPLDPDFPPERLRYIARDAALDALITDGDAEGLETGARVSLRDETDVIERSPAAPIADGPRAGDPAYVMYTSGSTGYPKGTVLTHRNVVNFFAGMDDRIGVGPGDTVLALTSISFDISVLELLWPIARGATVFVGPERMIDRLAPGGSEASFGELCARHRPSLLQATPSFFAAVVTQPEALYALRSLRALLVGGEALPSGLARQLLTALPAVRVFNMYGPTETTIWSTVHELARERDMDTDVIPVGRPIANTRLRVSSTGGADAPLGVAGELLIGGDGVAVGYRNKPELTAEKFVTDAGGARWYRTGDRARFRDDGVVEFLGRVDRQTKIAGHRIELDEVESVLSRHPGVESVAVVARKAASGATELVAYVAPSGSAAGTDAQRSHVDHWGQVWEMAYADAHGGPAPGDRSQESRDFAGWLSSYTGEPIPVDEMRSWLDRTVERCAALGTRRVVDVGVGVGLYLRKLSRHAETYLGLDLSETALRWAEQSLEAAGGSPARVTLQRGDALALADLSSGSADLVLINSVVQYFPSADYLRKVLHEAVRVAGPTGAVFVGDVRDLAVLDAFHAHVQVARAQPLATAADVAAAAARAVTEERELCLAETFFREFAAGEPGVGEVRFELKRGRALNELTRFRYDVTLLGRDRASDARGEGTRHAWTPALKTDDVAGLLARAPAGQPLTLADVPNRRLTQPLAAVALLSAAHAPHVTAWDLQRQLWEHDGADAVDPEDLITLAERHGRAALVIRAASGAAGHFDVVFAPKAKER